MEVSKILAHAKLRATWQRKAVLELLLEKGCPMSHGEVSAALTESLDRVTLYRTLQALTDAAIVHQVQGLDGAWRFCAHDTEASGCPGGHPHFLCVSCGRMTCLTDQPLQHIEMPAGVEVKGKQLVVYGRCANCARQSDE